MGKKKESTEGPPMYVESLMSREDWRENTKTYDTCNIPEPPEESDPKYKNKFKWRKGMGANLTAQEIRTVNLRIDAVIAKSKLKPAV